MDGRPPEIVEFQPFFSSYVTKGKARDIYVIWNNSLRYAPQQTALQGKTFGKAHDIYQIIKYLLRYATKKAPW